MAAAATSAFIPLEPGVLTSTHRHFLVLNRHYKTGICSLLLFLVLLYLPYVYSSRYLPLGCHICFLDFPAAEDWDLDMPRRRKPCLAAGWADFILPEEGEISHLPYLGLPGLLTLPLPLALYTYPTLPATCPFVPTTTSACNTRLWEPCLREGGQPLACSSS